MVVLHHAVLLPGFQWILDDLWILFVVEDLELSPRKVGADLAQVPPLPEPFLVDGNLVLA